MATSRPTEPPPCRRRQVSGRTTVSARSLPKAALLLAGGVLLAACGGGGGPAARPNVLLVTLDTTRADYFGSYGHPAGATPHFDALAAEGVLCELALATASVTPVSHASILTGLYQDRHRLRVLSAGSGYRLPADVPSLATRLRDEGWRTGAVHSAFPVSAYFGLDQGFDHFDSFEARMEVDDADGGSHRWAVDTHQRRSDETTDRAIEFLDAGDGPFFLWVHYWDPHDPVLLPPPEYRQGVPEGVRSPAMYAAELRYVDAQFGRLMAALAERGEDADTLVAVVADHGEGMNEHGWLFHRLLYQEQLHVPMLLRVPGGPVGQRLEGVVSTVDLAPTMLDYLGLSPLPGADGRSLRPALEGEAWTPRVVFADQLNGYDLNSKISRRRPYDDFLYAVVDDPWKLVYRPAHPDRSELFHLRDDPDEAVNRYADEAAVRDRLLRELARRAPWVSQPFPESGEDTTDAQAALAALGYAESEGGDAPGADAWEWVCVEHADEVAPAPRACSRCGEPRLPRIRTP